MSLHFFSFNGVLWGGDFFAFEGVDVAGEISFSLPFVEARGGSAVISARGGVGLEDFLWEVPFFCAVTRPVPDCATVAEIEEGPASGDETIAFSFFGGVAKAKMSSSGDSSAGFLRLPMTNFGSGFSFSFSLSFSLSGAAVEALCLRCSSSF